MPGASPTRPCVERTTRAGLEFITSFGLSARLLLPVARSAAVLVATTMSDAEVMVVHAATPDRDLISRGRKHTFPSDTLCEVNETG